VPSEVGVYLHKNANDQVIYVGKASDLRSRLGAYASMSPNNHERINDLIREIADFEYVLTDNEQAALLLENTLIKRHSPKYNIRLRDDKSYPYIKVDMRDDFPRVYITRNRSDKKALYFGPYATGKNIRRTLGLINKLFPYRSCSKRITGDDERPCLEYHIKRCIAPCVGYAAKEEYMEVIKQTVNFLQFGPKRVMGELKEEMRTASAKLEFERAAALRDRINSLSSLFENKSATKMKADNMDAIAFAADGDNAWVEIFFYRDGIMIGRDQFVLDGVESASNSQVLSNFIKRFYSLSDRLPKLIIAPFEVDDAADITQWLSAKASRQVRIQAPKRGHKKRILEVVFRNAALARNTAKLRNSIDANRAQIAVNELQNQLDLTDPPRRIECYDVSHIQGALVVASMAVFVDGQPQKQSYRKFKIQAEERFNDDFTAMSEILSRRLKYLKNETYANKGGFGDKPNLILIDGGKGQLSAAQYALLNSGIEGVQLAAIAKKEELIYLADEDEPLKLSTDSPALHLLQNARDEAHRFAVTFHRSKRNKSAVASKLDSVNGIGAARKKELLTRFGSLAGVKNASVGEIAAVRGVTAAMAIRLKETL